MRFSGCHHGDLTGEIVGFMGGLHCIRKVVNTDYRCSRFNQVRKQIKVTFGYIKIMLRTAIYVAT